MEMYFSIGFGYLEQTLIPAVVVWLMAACVQRALLCRTHRAVSSAKFAGQLGAQGSPADLMQMEKIQLIRNIKPEIEIGWDGGANISNIRALAHCDLDVINVGSAISQAENPADMFNQLVAEIDKSGVVL